MILMVSVLNLDEALQALKGGADIVDVKNLQEALVGSASPWVVRQVREAIPEPHHASVTLGVVTFGWGSALVWLPRALGWHSRLMSIDGMQY